MKNPYCSANGKTFFAPNIINIGSKNTSKNIGRKSNWYTLNTDSGVISRNLADHGIHGYTAALTWSGDALYAAQGAGEFEPYSGKEMHIQKQKCKHFFPYIICIISFCINNSDNQIHLTRYVLCKDVRHSIR